MITANDITDPTFTKLPSASKTAYLAQGEAMYNSLATRSNIDVDQVDETLYTPLRIMTVCTLISMCRDFIGSDFREVRDGFTIDVYKAKVDTYEKELLELLAQFTPTMCGYEETGDTSGTGSISVTWERA
jgi:hypothetical protein